MTTWKALPNYLKSIGVTDGLKVFTRSMRTRPRRSRNTERFRVSALGIDVNLRPTRADHSIFFQCIVQRQYDIRRFPQHMALTQLYERQCAAGEVPLIIDCGGNIGLSAIWFATQFPRARVLVVEPDTENLHVLRLNVAPFGDRIVVIEGAVWNRSTHLEIINPEAGSAAFRVEETEDSSPQSLRAFGMEQLCEMGGNLDPLIVKIDVEGAQGAIFASNTNWTRRAALISLELDDWLFPWKGTSRSFFRCLATQDFDYLLGGESIYCFNAAVLQSSSNCD